MNSELKEEPKIEADDEEKLSAKNERARTKLIESIAAQQLDTLEQKVCWLLNNHSSTRNSDITLMVKYWSKFEPEIFNGAHVAVNDLYRLTRLTSVARARAKIQNQYKLFLAKPEVRQHRGTLEEEEYERQVETIEDYPSITVYADESGKNQTHLVVGSIWFLDSKDVFTLTQAFINWRKDKNFTKEIHFQKTEENTVDVFFEFFCLAKQITPTISFRYISVPREGISNISEAFKKLFGLILERGLIHDLKAGRLALPRSLSLFKDSEEAGSDKMLLADIRSDLETASALHWERKLEIDTLEAVSSSKNDVIQLADLFTSSVGRRLNRQSTSERPKDRLADAILTSLGASSPDTVEFEGNTAAEILI